MGDVYSHIDLVNVLKSKVLGFLGHGRRASTPLKVGVLFSRSKSLSP